MALTFGPVPRDAHERGPRTPAPGSSEPHALHKDESMPVKQTATPNVQKELYQEGTHVSEHLQISPLMRIKLGKHFPSLLVSMMEKMSF